MIHRPGVRLGAALVAVAILLAGARIAGATPLYAGREGRTCDNCHLTPNGWENPALAERKCTMSCQSCHVDPSGGGLRNVFGRFFGRSTLPMIATSPRPTSDWDRNVFAAMYRRDRATTYTDSLPRGPATLEESRSRVFQVHDLWGKGRPLGGASRFAGFQGRAGALNTDPLLRVGWDFRVAALAGTGSIFFPMQADLSAALHPVEHVTFLANVGARGHNSGWVDTFDDPETPYLREGVVILHEAPFMSYVKAGRFVPSYGLRIDDHTAQTRRLFEIDEGIPESRVTGIEAGLNPNYPYVRVAWFRSTGRYRTPPTFDILDLDPGHGYALDLGYRDLGFGIGASALQRRRPVACGGDENSYAVIGSFNPSHYSRSLPLTWQAEFDFGNYRRESGLEARRRAFYQELDWLAGNGLNVLVAQDWSDPDREVKDDESIRVSAGAQVTPIPGITVDGRIRGLLPKGEASGMDFFLQVHFWN